MVPTKIRTNVPVAARRSITTRSRNQNAILMANDRVKRKANSPAKGMTLKRSAFGDVTNAIKKTITTHDKFKKTTTETTKKVTVQSKVLQTVKTVIKPKQNENIAAPAEPKKKIVTRASLRNIVPTNTATKPKEVNKTETNKVKTRLSNEFEKTNESLYTSALENLLV